MAKAARRRFSQEYKRKVLKEADACRQPGEIGALLRREGLYSSHLSSWRASRDRGDLGGTGLKKRGVTCHIVSFRKPHIDQPA